MSQSNSVLDDPQIAASVTRWVQGGETNASIVRKIDDIWDLTTSESSIKRFRARHGLKVPGQTGGYTKIADNTAEAATDPIVVDESLDVKAILTDPDTMLRQRGLDPEDWVITHMTPNMWDGPNSASAREAGGPAKITYYQTKFSCQHKRPPELQIMAPRTDGWRPPAPSTTGQQMIDGGLVVVVGDQQAPFQDNKLHELFLNWLSRNTPERAISLGDSVDFPDISRHQLDPENTATVNECLQAGYDLFRDYVEASPETWWTKMIGNHDERIRNLLLDKPKNNALYGIKRPDTEYEIGEDILGLEHAMRLDELGITVIDPKGKYDLAQVNITDKLAVRHGWIARKGSGASALGSLEHLGYSIIVGHTHRQAQVHHTKHEMSGALRTITGVEAGCMCRVDQTPGDDGRIWPNFTVTPDWQQGFATVQVWDDGSFSIDLAKYVNGKLYWRDQRYS